MVRRDCAVPSQADVTQWQVTPELAHLFDQPRLPLSEWLQSGKAKIVKSGRHRAVYWLDLPCGTFYLKHYKAAGTRDLVQSFLRGSRAQLEFKAAQAVAAADILTFEPVAIGQTVRGRTVADSFLLSREIERTEPLDQFVTSAIDALPPRRAAQVRQSISIELGLLTANLHRAGLIHRDYHAGNILIRVGEDGVVGLWLIDLHAVSRCRFPSRRRLEDNLAQLNNFFAKHATASDRHRFFSTYWDAFHFGTERHAPDHELQDAFPRAAHRMERVLQHTLAEAYRKGDRKWARGNRRLIIADSASVRCRGLAWLGPELIASIRDDPDSMIAGLQNSPDVCRANNQLEGAGLVTPQGVVRVAVTTFDDQTVQAGSANSVSRRAWERGHALSRRGVGVARPLAFVDRTGVAQHLISELPANSSTLAQCLSRSLVELDEPTREKWLRHTCTMVGRRLHRLRSCGFEHRNLSGENILVSDRWDSRDCWLTSLADVHRRRPFSFDQTGEWLGNLDASLSQRYEIRLTHKLRFLRSYIGSARSRSWKRIWRAIETHSRKPEVRATGTILAPRQVHADSRAA